MKQSNKTPNKMILSGLFIGLIFLLCCQSGQQATPPPGSGQPPKQDKPAPDTATSEIDNAQPAPDGVATPPPIVTEEMMKASIGEKIPKDQCETACSNEKILKLALKCKLSKKKTIQGVAKECISGCKEGQIGTNTLGCFENYTDCKQLTKCARAPSPEDSGVLPDPPPQNQGKINSSAEPPPVPSEKSESPPETADTPLDPATKPPLNEGEVEPKADSKIE